MQIAIPDMAPPVSKFSPLTPPSALEEESSPYSLPLPASRIASRSTSRASNVHDVTVPPVSLLTQSRNVSPLPPSIDEVPDEKPLPAPSPTATSSQEDFTARLRYPTNNTGISTITSKMPLNGKFVGFPKREAMDLPSPSSFQFPISAIDNHTADSPTPTRNNSTAPAPPPFQRRPTYQASEAVVAPSEPSRPSSLLSTHQNTQSLDVPPSIVSRHEHMQPSISRTRSATTLPPPLKVNGGEVSVQKPVIAVDIKRANENTAHHPPAPKTPGLKDVLKVSSSAPKTKFSLTNAL